MPGGGSVEMCVHGNIHTRFECSFNSLVLSVVFHVIPRAPCFGLTAEFIQKWNIHVVLLSEEYDKPDDNYYRVMRDLHSFRM